jgi:quinol monooxygenase YgiN
MAMGRRSFMRLWASAAATALVGCAAAPRQARPVSQTDLDAERSRKVVLISRIKPKAGAGREIEAAIREFYAAVRRAEPGCLVNAMHRAAGPPGQNADPNATFQLAGAEPSALVFYEVYRDQESARQHTSTPHFRALMARIGDLIDGRIELEFLQELGSVDRADSRRDSAWSGSSGEKALGG